MTINMKVPTKSHAVKKTKNLLLTLLQKKL